MSPFLFMQSLYFLSNFLNFLFTCLPSFFCLSEAIFYKIYMVYRDVITMLIYGFTTISIFTFSEAFVGEIQHCLPEAICCYITLFTEILSQKAKLRQGLLYLTNNSSRITVSH